MNGIILCRLTALLLSASRVCTNDGWKNGGLLMSMLSCEWLAIFMSIDEDEHIPGADAGENMLAMEHAVLFSLSVSILGTRTSGLSLSSVSTSICSFSVLAVTVSSTVVLCSDGDGSHLTLYGILGTIGDSVEQVGKLSSLWSTFTLIVVSVTSPPSTDVDGQRIWSSLQLLSSVCVDSISTYVFDCGSLSDGRSELVTTSASGSWWDLVLLSLSDRASSSLSACVDWPDFCCWVKRSLFLHFARLFWNHT